ncbi:ester cyclase [Paenibacillus caseinilyticus]|uniref:ester cyclase n=1 Tax=Paenibacillus caseinilyticus TaxID=3098138 RepID=UPI0022B87B9B|nr:ester cyclase [Paenibacillus caseinilyticus]MCZ8518538.1 ester cyclase [Paenibacillus caseinilyticus]
MKTAARPEWPAVCLAAISAALLLVPGCSLKGTGAPSPAAQQLSGEIRLLEDLPQPRTLTADASLSRQEAEAMVQAAQRFYGFWDTGREDLLPQTVVPHFIDHTLPKGRPQGPEGLAFASRGFRQAVPDLHCIIEELTVAGDRVTARLSFTGTHTGEFAGAKATGKPIRFMAIDMLRIKEGKLVEDWHLEDNLTFMQQIGAIPES